MDIFLKENNEQGLVSFAGRWSLEVGHFLPKPHASVGPERCWSVEISHFLICEADNGKS